jgi:hypothetical protein
MKETYKAWALKGKCPVGYHQFYLGRYWWFDGVAPQIPIQFEGCENCLFKTKRAARGALKLTGLALSDCWVQRVKVTVEDV